MGYSSPLLQEEAYQGTRVTQILTLSAKRTEFPCQPIVFITLSL